MVHDTEQIEQLSEKKYTERVNVLKYSITFADSAVAFIVTAKTLRKASQKRRNLSPKKAKNPDWSYRPNWS